MTGESKKAVVLLSGGMDSATAMAIAASEGFVTHALTFRYGQRHRIEVGAARRVAAHLGATAHLVVDLEPKLFHGSALTAPGPEAATSNYVPARNTVFLSMALAWCEGIGASDIFVGMAAADYANFPDCRPEYLTAFEAMANLATRLPRVHLHAPLVSLSKAEIITRGLALGVDFSLTRSCYAPGARGQPCGACEACGLRAEGFRGAGLTDPALILGRQLRRGTKVVPTSQDSDSSEDDRISARWS